MITLVSLMALLAPAAGVADLGEVAVGRLG